MPKTSNAPERLSLIQTYPLAENPPYPVTERLYKKYGPKRSTGRIAPGGFSEKHAWMKKHIRAIYAGEHRPPRKGEWYLSGGTIAAYQAPNDLATPYAIAVLIRVEEVITEIKHELTPEDLNG